jgi:hypothetical protein
MGLPDKAQREKRAKFRDLAKRGKVQTGSEYEKRRQQLELDFERRPAPSDRKRGTSR